MNRIKIMDFLSGKDVWKYYQLYLKTQWYSEEEMKRFQIGKLKKLLEHCYNNVPYYRDIIENNKIDYKNFKSLEILNEFPILTKEIIQENYNDFYPKNFDLIRGHKISQTGGTTGNILIKRNDSATRSSIWGSYQRYEDWMGLSKSNKSLILMGGHVKKTSFKSNIIHSLSNILDNSVNVDIYNTSDGTLEKIIELLENNKFSHIRSYPQFLFSVAKKLEMRGLNYKIDAISTTAEPVMQVHRDLFRKVFNTEVFDQFGCGEIGGVAYECEKHEGLHIAEERVIVEVNKRNELIITDLDNLSMPFIRYWNADQAIISEKKCSCGRQSKLIKEIMGRTCDYVLGLNGEFLHWAYFWHLIFDSNVAKNRNLKKFQIIQKAKDEILFRLVSSEFSDEERKFITNDVISRLGNIKVNFTYESEIENTKTGKYRPIINEII